MEHLPFYTLLVPGEVTQYDRVINGRTSGRMLGPCNILVIEELYFDLGTISWTLLKPPQMRQGPVPCPLRLLVETFASIGSWFAYKLRVAHTTLVDVTGYFYIFL